jgi:RNase adapter protein RapZ
MKYEVISFGFKYGTPEGYAIIDCRVLRNPHHAPELKPLTGLDLRVKRYVNESAGCKTLLLQADSVNTNKIAFGCIGGKHRSVAMAELFKDMVETMGHEVEIKHTALETIHANARS